MKKTLPLLSIALLCSVLTSCDAIAGIFKTGMWFGIIGVIVVIALVIWLISKVF